MSTFTFRVTSSATPPNLVGFGQQPDNGAPSYLDMIVTNSTDPVIVNGTYDAYCLDPSSLINVRGQSYTADALRGDVAASYQTIGLTSLTQDKVDQISWLLAQNFTSDPKYGGQFNYGEVQLAIWDIVGFPGDGEHIAGSDPRYINDNNRNVVDPADVSFLVSASANAVANGEAGGPSDAFFSAVIDPQGTIQPLIVQLQKAKLGNFVWFDDNANGVQDNGEAGVDNVIVQLYDGEGHLLATTSTGDDYSTAAVETGYYQFTGLKAGNYQVKFIAPSDMVLTSTDTGANDAIDSDADQLTGLSSLVALAAGESNQTIDAGLVEVASLGDYVWLDANNDGQQDDGAASGVNGVTVKLYKGDGTLVSSTTTANDTDGNPGYYKFIDLMPGDYKVEFIKPAGYAFAQQNVGADASDSDADTGTGLTATTTLVSGENDLTLDAGLVKLASLGDYVWKDKNNDGKQNDGFYSGMNGVTVKLYKSDGSLVATTTTGNDSHGKAGYYKFSDLNPGEYKVEFVKPDGYTFAKQNVGSNSSDSDADPSTGMTAVISLAPGENDMRWDAGLVRFKSASIGDFVWEDMNMNGIQDAGEKGIANVTVKLLNSAGDVVETTKTSASGKYLFDDLNPGEYQIQVVKPSGYYVTKQNQGSNDGADSDISSAGTTALTTLSSGENDLKWDAGLYRKASVGDKVWDDMDHDNVQDVKEPGIGGITVKLMTTSGVVLATTKTDSKGNYLFDDLDPGTYVLQFDKGGVKYYQYNRWNNMSDWKWAVKNKGWNDAIDSDVAGNAISTTNVSKTDPFTLVSGENDMTRDAGITPLVIDLNGDGIQTISRADTGGKFDLLGNGTAITSGWISDDDGFLAVDSNGNGRIDDISELFGGLDKGDGFAKLAAFDSNNDGVVNANDNGFGSLRIWQDSNGNHQSDDGELLSLVDAGVASLNVGYEELPFLDAQGNVHLERSNAILADGSSVDMTDVYFNVDRADANVAGVELAGVNTLTGYDAYIAA